VTEAVAARVGVKSGVGLKVDVGTMVSLGVSEAASVGGMAVSVGVGVKGGASVAVGVSVGRGSVGARVGSSAGDELHAAPQIIREKLAINNLCSKVSFSVKLVVEVKIDGRQFP
jgi:hypothetical protein